MLRLMGSMETKGGVMTDQVMPDASANAPWHRFSRCTGPVFGAILAAVLLFVLAGCDDVRLGSTSDSEDQQVTETRDDTFVFRSSITLSVESFNGDITVSAGINGEARVHAELERPDKIDYSASQEGSTVSVVARRTGSTIGRSPGVDIVVVVPKATKVELETSNGAIEISGLEGSGTLSTSNGKITMTSLKGDFTAGTSNGSVEVTSFLGTTKLETSNGSVSFSGELVPDGENEIRSSNGSIDVTLKGTPSVRFDASTSNGTVKTNQPFVATTTGDDHLAGTIGDGEATLEVRTSNGSITVQ